MFTNYYPPSQGGIETSVLNLCAGLKKAGHETFIFAPEYPSWKQKEKYIFRYKSISFTYAGYLYVIPVLFFSGMEKIAEGLKLDIIHSHQPYSLGDEALKFSKKFKIPIVFTYHIKYEDYSHYIPFIPWFISKPFIKNITKSYCGKCDAVIAPSTAVKKLIAETAAKTRVEIIPSGIDIENFGKNRNTRDKIREKYKIKSEEIVLITASRIVLEKNMEFLIKSFSLIKKSFQNVKFLVVGEGGARKKLEALAKDLKIESSIIFTGLASKEEIINLYQASDIFVFSSLTETQGLVAVEAMSAGLPIVAIKASGIEDIISDGKNGFLVSNSIEEFCGKISKIINDNYSRGQFAIQAKVSSERFSQELWVKKIISLYESLV